MELVVKKFKDLTVYELYEILKKRVDVFVVEQKCPYADIDDVDQDSYHLYLKDDEGIQAYIRVVPEGRKLKEVSIGRVISLKRGCGLATILLKEGIKLAQSEFNATKIEIEAQSYARSLYEKVGFKQVTEEFLEDDIPHIGMMLEL